MSNEIIKSADWTTVHCVCPEERERTSQTERENGGKEKKNNTSFTVKSLPCLKCDDIYNSRETCEDPEAAAAAATAVAVASFTAARLQASVSSTLHWLAPLNADQTLLCSLCEAYRITATAGKKKHTSQHGLPSLSDF